MLGAGLIALLCAIVAAAAVGLLWSARNKKRCPSCGVELVAVGQGAADDGLRLTYDVLACPHCTNALTMVEGTRARYAWCPECRERTLETPCIRLPDQLPTGDGTGGGGRRVEVHEHCHLCGHLAVREVSDVPPAQLKRGQVLQFPFDRRKQRKKSANNE